MTPEPDFAVVGGPEEIYFRRHPGPREIGLLIGVADSTLLDRYRRNGRICDAARIPHYAELWSYERVRPMSVGLRRPNRRINEDGRRVRILVHDSKVREAITIEIPYTH